MARLLVVTAMFGLCTGGTVYYGSLDDAKKPAEIVAQKVFDKIPEYREIKNKGLDEDDPEYWSLLSKANDKFYEAVRTVAQDKGYDVVVEKGSADLKKKAPDITQKVIGALPK
ncbi:MAG: hypothetical protein ACYTAF_02125 [Planctomycetota bacterium]|jgi:Skp family chaperone for outer membrane proteins